MTIIAECSPDVADAIPPEVLAGYLETHDAVIEGERQRRDLEAQAAIEAKRAAEEKEIAKLQRELAELPEKQARQAEQLRSFEEKTRQQKLDISRGRLAAKGFVFPGR